MEPLPHTEESAEPLEQLRKLLLRPDRQEIQEIKAQVADRSIDAESLSEALPDAFVHASQRDHRLAKAIAPPVEEALQESIRRNPKSVAEVLFPVIGPAIRKAIAAALHGMQDALNAALEKSVSPSAVRWRIEAARTGRPYGEVVMAHTLQYRVTHVLLIHAESGLLLAHVAAPEEPEIEAELTSGMMQAILAFGRESFGRGKAERLDQLRIGAFNLLVENGPRAMLAVSVQGFPSPALRAALADALESIHLEYGEALRTFDGDRQIFAAARPVLEACLLEERLSRTPKGVARREHDRRKAAVAAAVLLALLIPALLYLRINAQWTQYRRSLRSEPGFLVLESGRSGLHYFVRGLRDPLARDPEALRRASGLPAGRLRQTWDSYASGAPPFVLARAQRILGPPPSVRLAFSAGTLFPVGEADHAWIKAARRAEPLLPAGAVVSFARTVDRDRARVAGLLDEVPRDFDFVSGVRLRENEWAELRRAAARLREIAAAAPRGEQRVHVFIVGATDTPGPGPYNQELRRRRATWVRDFLVARGVPRAMLEVRSGGQPPLERAVKLDPQIAEAPQG